MSQRAHPFKIDHKQMSESFNVDNMRPDLFEWLHDRCGYSRFEGSLGFYIIDGYELDLLTEAIQEGEFEKPDEIREFITSVRADIKVYDPVHRDAVHYIIY